jgi:hypothetical protein
MSYKVITNGLWSEESRNPISITGTRGVFSQLDITNIGDYTTLTEEVMEEAITEVFNTPAPERDIVLHTGPAGLEQFDIAVRDAFQEQLDEAVARQETVLPESFLTTSSSNTSATNGDEYTWDLRGNDRTSAALTEGSMVDITSVDPIAEGIDNFIGFSQPVTTPNFLEVQTALLQNGDIDMMTFLDNISEHDEQQN